MTKWLKKIFSTKGGGLINVSFIINSIKNVKNADVSILNNHNPSIESPIDFSNLEKSSFRTINTEIKDYYEERLYDKEKAPNDLIIRSLFSDDEQDTLVDIVSKNKKVILLGNAGVGKTIELKHIFNVYWENRIQNNIFPIYIDLKSFRDSNKIDDYIKYSYWKRLPKTILVLDGLDEVSNVQGVVSGLESFIAQNSENEISYLLSCRTNIYEKFLIELHDFQKFYLKPLTNSQSDRILQNNFDIHLNYHQLNQYDSYLENPFHLNLFAKYYLENKSFPNSNAEMWDLIIKNEIETLFLKKTKKRNQDVDVPNLYSIIEKVSIVNELSQKSYITDGEISEIISVDDKKIFKELPFIERYSDESTYFFIHKNYQEFFAARFISKLSTDKIVTFIQVENTGKTKPTLFNVISFLLNILDDSKSKELINWLSENENEVVFSSEPEKIDEQLRNKVFKVYFEKTCIENTFWINDDRKIKIEQLARFANLDYLLSIIQDNTQLYRAIESAIIVLQNLKIPSSRNEEIKSILYNLLKANNLDKTKDEETDSKIKAEILRCIQEQKYHLTDKDFFNKIYRLFINETGKEINHIMISVIKDFDDVDEFFGYIEKEIHLRLNLKQRKFSNEISYGFDYVFEGIIDKIKDENNFLKCIDFIFNPNLKSINSSLDSIKDRRLEMLIEKHKKYFQLDNHYLFRFLDLFIGYDDYHNDEDELDKIIKSTQSEEITFNYIFDKVGFGNHFYFLLIRICNENNISHIVECHKEGKLKQRTIDYLDNFRWQLFHGRKENEGFLAKLFTKKMQEIGFVFKNNLPTKEESDKEKFDFEEFAKWNFDLVFNKGDLLVEIKKVFMENNSNEMTLNQASELNAKWYKETNYHGLIKTSLTTIINLTRVENPITYDRIEELLSIESNHLKLIKEKIKENRPIQKVSPEHIEFIKNKCEILISELEKENYQNVIIIDDSKKRSFSYYPKNYNKIKLLYFFDIKFSEIKFDKAFYRNTLQYAGAFYPNDKEKDIFEHIREQIASENDFKLLIIENIKSKNLDFNTLKLYCNYIVDERIEEFYDFVGNAITESEIGHSHQLLEKYIERINYDFDFLRKCCANIASFECWNTIRQYLKNSISEKNFKDFISDVALKYIDTKDYSNINTAIDVLFYCNKNNAIEIYWKLIDINSKELSRRDYEVHSFKFYNHFNELHLLKDIFKLVYSSSDYRDFYMARNFLSNLTAHISSTKIGYEKIKEILLEIKDSVISETEIFYINQLIKTSDNSYFNSLLKTPNLQTAKKITTNALLE